MFGIHVCKSRAYMYVWVIVCKHALVVCVYVCFIRRVCICVCVRERERERESGGDGGVAIRVCVCVCAYVRRRLSHLFAFSVMVVALRLMCGISC